MTKKEMYERLSELRKIPPLARRDYRLHLKEHGELPWMSEASRSERRRIEANSKKIGRQYEKIIKETLISGAGFPVDQVLRQLAVEYTNRYASSGTETQPVSFNYFEPFCEIQLIENSVAPYATLAAEVDHLFDLVDFLDYQTSPESSEFDLAPLLDMPEGKSFHFTANGDLLDLRFMDAEGTEFVVSGFSMVRRQSSLHWYIVGGEVFDEEGWRLLSIEKVEFDPEDVIPQKREFLAELVGAEGPKAGPPVPLEGTERVLRTIASGEIDIPTKKHLGRCLMWEHEKIFNIACDDPEIFMGFGDEKKHEETLKSMMLSLNRASGLWDLAESLVQLPRYFSHKIEIAKAVLVKSGKRQVLKRKGGQGVGAKYKVVSAIDVVDGRETAVRSVKLPHYVVETEGHWRRLKLGAVGTDMHGDEVRGKTWVRRQSKWRAREHDTRFIYVKDSLAAAKLKVAEIQKAAVEASAKVQANDIAQGNGELYVMRCAVMEEQIYKVGWTSGDSTRRAEEISSATGVPLSFVVIESWKHANAKGLETEVHNMLAPYRINESREFFKASFAVIKRIVEATIDRTNRKL